MLNRLHTFDSLADKSYLYLWLGQVGTGLCQWMDLIARGWLVYFITHSPLHLGLVTAARGAPMLLFGLIAGVVADRSSRRLQLTLSALIDAGMSLILATLVVTHRVEIWHIYVTAFLAGTAQAFQTPARMALVHDLVGKEKLLNAVALLSAAFNASRGVGPALAGILITYFGVGGSYYMQFMAGIATAIWTLQIRVPQKAGVPLPEQSHSPASYYQSTMEGLRYVFSHRLIFPLMILGLAPMVLAMPFTSLFPIFAVDVLKVGAAGQGLLLSCLGIGAMGGALTVASMRGGPMGKLMLISAAIFGISLMLFSHSQWMWFSMTMAFVAGVANTSYTSQNQTIIQMMAPDHMRGRVLSIYMTNRAFTPLGTALAGLLAHAFGGPNAVLIMGLDTLVLVLLIGILVPGIAALGSTD